MDEEQFRQLSSTSLSRLEILEKFPSLNIFENVKQKWEFLKKLIQHYESLPKNSSSDYGPLSFTEMLRTLCHEIDKDLLSSLEFITVSKLVEEFTESCKLSLPLGSTVEAEEESISLFSDSVESINEDNPTNCLPIKNFLLIAKLMQSLPDPPSIEHLSSFLFLFDGSSKVPCLIKASLCDEMLPLLNNWILIVDANWICGSKLTGILEICRKPIPLSSFCVSKRNSVSALDVKSASSFIRKREKFKLEEICVAGFVSAVSEIVKIKQNVVFLVELSHEDDQYSCFILLKDHFLHWQQLLNPGTSYVFSALRVSTIKKGCGSCPVRVFVPSTTCKVWPQKYCLLERYKIKDLLLEEFKREEIDFPEENKVSDLTSYEGCITNNDQAAIGIYILNHQVRLHLCYVSLVHDFSHLRVGSIVKVHNAHIEEHSGVPNIFCCMKACVKVLEFSPSNTPPVLLSVNSAQVMAFSHTADVNWLLEVRNWFINNSSLLGLKHQRQTDFIWNSFLLSTLGKKTEMKTKSRRNLLQEFFMTDHKCPIVINRSVADGEQFFPSVVCLSKLLEEEFPNPMKEQKQQTMTETCANMEENFWDPFVKIIQGTKMLIGYMALSSDSGRLCLVDRSNSINIVCQPWQMVQESDTSAHTCTAGCLLQQRESKLVFCCPFAHSWCLGRLVIIDKYQMVLEKFNFGSNAESFIKYIQFSLNDLVALNSSLPPEFFPKFGLNSNGAESTDGDNICTCQMFMLLCKQSLRGQHISPGNIILSFIASGFFLGNTFQLPAKDVFRYLTKFPTSEQLQNINSSLENQCDNRKDAVDGTDYYRVVLFFENIQAQWYDLLQNVGSCYILVVRGNNPQAFISTQHPSVEKALRKSKSKCPVQMPRNAFLQELSDWHFHTIYKTQKNTLLNLRKIVFAEMSSQNSPAYSVSDIISPSFSESIVSLMPTVIFSRTHPENKYTAYRSAGYHSKGPIMNPCNSELELSNLEDKSIKLVLQDLKSSEELVLFMNLEDTSYPLGLLEGAIVEFHHLQRCVSKNNNVYCKFIAVSSVRVLAMSHTGKADLNSWFPGAQHQNSKVNVRNEWGFLSVMLTNDYSNKSSLWMLAFISQVKTLKVKTVCTKCSCVSFSHKCSDKTCNNTQFRTSVYICLLLDDGTCTAYAYSWQEDLFLQILSLSKTQWKDLVYLIHSKFGEICLDSKSSSSDFTEETSVHHFLNALCNSPLVKRKWWMKLRRKTNLSTFSNEGRFPFQEIWSVSGKIKTKCLPFLKVEILSLQEVAPFDILTA